MPPKKKQNTGEGQGQGQSPPQNPQEDQSEHQSQGQQPQDQHPTQSAQTQNQAQPPTQSSSSQAPSQSQPQATSAKVGKKWTEDEDALMDEYARQGKSDAELAKELGRSVPAVRNRRFKAPTRVKAPQDRVGPVEEQLVAKLSQQGLSQEEIARRTGRVSTTVKAILERLEGTTPWTDTDTTEAIRLRSLPQPVSFEEIAKRLHKVNAASVVAKIGKLLQPGQDGSRKPWTTYDIATASEMKSQGATHEEIATKLGRPPGGVAKKLAEIELRYYKVKAPQNTNANANQQEAGHENEAENLLPEAFSREEDQQMLHLYFHGHQAGSIAGIIKRKKTAVEARLLQLLSNLPPCPCCNKQGHEETHCPKRSELDQAPRPIPQHAKQHLVCSQCGEYGHSRDDCMSCTNCGLNGHSASSCLSCRHCGTFGHNASACQSQESYPQSALQSMSLDPCEICDATDHDTVNCPNGFCILCGGLDHNISKCPHGCPRCLKTGHEEEACHVPCPVCLRTGHAAVDCPAALCPSLRGCGRCGNVGHDLNRCPQPCLNCEGHGHSLWECPFPAKLPVDESAQFTRTSEGPATFAGLAKKRKRTASHGDDEPTGPAAAQTLDIEMSDVTADPSTRSSQALPESRTPQASHGAYAVQAPQTAGAATQPPQLPVYPLLCEICCLADHQEPSECPYGCQICGEVGHDAVRCPKDHHHDVGAIQKARDRHFSSTDVQPELRHYCYRHGCTESFNRYEELQTHLENCRYNGARRWPCLFAGCPFSGQMEASRYLHTASCPFSAHGTLDVRRAEAIDRHIRSHPLPIEGPFSCERIGCDFTHADAGTLISHGLVCDFQDAPKKATEKKLPESMYLCGNKGCNSYSFSKDLMQKHRDHRCFKPKPRSATHGDNLRITDPSIMKAIIRTYGPQSDKDMLAAIEASGNQSTAKPPGEQSGASQTENDQGSGASGTEGTQESATDVLESGLTLRELQGFRERQVMGASTVTGLRGVGDELILQMPVEEDGYCLFRSFAVALFGSVDNEFGDERHWPVVRQAAQRMWNSAMNIADHPTIANLRMHLYAQLDEQSIVPNAAQQHGGIIHNSRLFDQLFQPRRYSSDEMSQILADAFGVEIFIHTAHVQPDGSVEWALNVRGDPSAANQVHVAYYPWIRHYQPLLRTNPEFLTFHYDLPQDENTMIRSPIPTQQLNVPPIPNASRLPIPWHEEEPEEGAEQATDADLEDDGDVGTGKRSNTNPRPTYASKGRVVRVALGKERMKDRINHIRTRFRPQDPEQPDRPDTSAKDLMLDFVQYGPNRVIDVREVPRSTRRDLQRMSELFSARNRRRTVEAYGRKIELEIPVDPTGTADSRYTTFDVEGGKESFAMHVERHAGEVHLFKDVNFRPLADRSKPLPELMYHEEREQEALERGVYTIAIGRFSGLQDADTVEQYLDSHDDVNDDFVTTRRQEEAQDATMIPVLDSDFLERIWINDQSAAHPVPVFANPNVIPEHLDFIQIMDNLSQEHPAPDVYFLIRSLAGFTVNPCWRRIRDRWPNLRVRLFFALRIEMVQELQQGGPAFAASPWQFFGPSPLGMYYIKDEIDLTDLALAEDGVGQNPACLELLRVFKVLHSARTGGMPWNQATHVLHDLGWGRNRFWP